MDFYISPYRIFRTKDKIFLFLIEENAIFEINNKIEDVLKKMKNKSKVSSSFLKNLPIEENIIETLKQIHFLKLNDQKIDSKWYLKDIPFQTLVLQTTTNCNFKCSYCYYHESILPKTMKPEIAERSIDMLFERSANEKNLTIVFFGGEPLLNFKLIKKVVTYIEKKIARIPKNIKFSLTTNGSLITNDMAKFFKDYNFSVTVSIDGYSEIQNYNRKFLNGDATYDKVMSGVDCLLNCNVPAVARVTLTKQFVKEVEIIIEHLLNVGFVEVGISPVTSNDCDLKLNSKDLELLLNKFEFLSYKFLNYAINNKFWGFSNIIEILVTLHEGETKEFPCGAGLGLFAVNPEGDIFPCQRFLNQGSFKMGNVFDGLDNAKVIKFREDGVIYQRSKCTNCWAQRICAGGCYHEALVCHGNPFSPNLHYCSWIKKWIDIGLKVYCELSSKNPKFLNNISILRGYY